MLLVKISFLIFIYLITVLLKLFIKNSDNIRNENIDLNLDLKG